MKSFIDAANPGETKKAYEMRVIDGFTTKWVLGGLEEGSQEMKGGSSREPPSIIRPTSAPSRGTI